MVNLFRKCYEWVEREGARAKASGGFRLFWFSLTCGLAWAIFMFSWLTVSDYLSDDPITPWRTQTRASVFFVAGMAFGFLLWACRKVSGKSQSPRA